MWSAGASDSDRIPLNTECGQRGEMAEVGRPVRRTARVTTESVTPAQAGIHAILATAPLLPTSDVLAMLGCSAVGNAENKRTTAFAWIPACAGMTEWGEGLTESLRTSIS